MPRHRFTNLGASGLNTDLLQSSSSIDSWSELLNVVAVDGYIRSTYGEEQKILLPIKPKYHYVFRDLEANWYIIISNGIDVYKIAVSDGEATDITPAVPPTTASFVTFATLNGVLVVNFADFAPYYLDSTDVLTALPGWSEDWSCLAIIAYRYYLVALNMTEGEAKYPHKLRWSSSAEDGAVPTEWIAETDNDAGDDLLGESLGHIIGGVVIRDYLYIVKEDALYSMSYIGGTYVMRVDRLHGASGTQLLHGFTEIKGQIVTCDLRDVRLFDGNQSISLTDKRVRASLKELVKQDKAGRTQVFRHTNSGLLFISSVFLGDARLRKALVYDFVTDLWWEKTLNYSYGFDSAPVTTDDTPISEVIVYESNEADDEWWVSVLGTVDTSSDEIPKACSAIKVGMPIENISGIAMVNEAWLEFDGSITVTVTFGSQDSPNGIVTWGDAEQWIPGITTSLHPRITGRYFAISISSEDDGYWKIGSVTINWSPAGER